MPTNVRFLFQNIDTVPDVYRNMGRAVLLAFVILLSITCIAGCHRPDYYLVDWSDGGDLVMEISLPSDVIEVNGSDRWTVTFTNPNDHKLGFIAYHSYWISVHREDGIEVEFIGIHDDIIGPSNDDIIVLDPEGSYTETYKIVQENWMLVPGTDYYADGLYRDSSDDTVTKPHWDGEIETERYYFSVV